MYEIRTTRKFLKDLKRIKRRSLSDFRLLEALVGQLAYAGHEGLAPKHKPHRLKGEYNGLWECHVKPDLLLVWHENDGIQLIELVRTGTHSDLF